jgi:steroid delta-isomerase-like uncharacterized protein
MSEANIQLMRHWFEEAWNKKREAAIDEMLADDVKTFGIPEAGGFSVGRDAFRAVHRSFCGAFPDMRMTIEDILADGDRVALRWHMTASHTGEHLGFPATGKKTALDGSSFCVIRDGRIAEGWNLMDMGDMIQKLRA